MTSVRGDTQRCPKCGSEHIRKEKIGSSLASGVFLVVLVVTLLWPRFNEVLPVWKVAGAVGIVVGVSSIWSGLSVLIGRRAPLVRCLECSYRWPWG